MLDTGVLVYKKGLVFELFPVTRHNKELVEAQPWTSRSIAHPQTFTAHMHTQVEGGRKRDYHITVIYVLRLLVGSMRHSP